jgi:hypothetical protein
MKPATKERSKPFICDVPATFLKRSTKLSRSARMLYMAMRALANGKTGELAIRGNPLDWRYISKQAEIGRNVWQRCLKELIAAGYVTREREIVEHYKDGRKRMVWGRAHYFAHRQPKTVKKPMILPMPLSCTVEEKGTQIFSETPYCLERGAPPASEEQKSVERRDIKSSSGAPPTLDDDFSSTSLDSEANPFLPEETKILMGRIRRRLRERWPHLFEPYQKHVQDDDFLASAIGMIGERGEERIINQIAYFTTALVEILVHADGPDPETFDDDFGWLVEIAEKKRQLREKYLGKLQPLTAEQDQARQQFNRMVDGKIQ